MKQKLYSGTSKNLYQSDTDYNIVMSFNDSIKKRNQQIVNINGKGIINNNISAYIMQTLNLIGIENHLIKKCNMRQQLIKFVDALPIQICICKIAYGRYVTDFGIEKGFVFEQPNPVATQPPRKPLPMQNWCQKKNGYRFDLDHHPNRKVDHTRG